MQSCPDCGNPLADDFGLVECARCGAALFVEFDGSVQKRDAQAGDPSNNPPDNETSDDADGYNDQPNGEEYVANPPLDDATEQIQTSDAIEPPVGFEENLDVPMDPAPEVYAPPISDESSSDMSDVAAFGNTEESSATDGRLYYKVSLYGIDTGDVREAVKEVLNDRMFMWDVEEMIRGIEDGRLEIGQISAVKASILVSRLVGLPIKVEWVQNVVS